MVYFIIKKNSYQAVEISVSDDMSIMLQHHVVYQNCNVSKQMCHLLHFAHSPPLCGTSSTEKKRTAASACNESMSLLSEESVEECLPGCEQVDMGYTLVFYLL